MICELDRESLEQRHAKWRLINFYKVIYYILHKLDNFKPDSFNVSPLFTLA